MKLENTAIVYFSPLNWHDNWQRQQEFASRMAEKNFVLFVTPMGLINYSVLGVFKKAFLQLFGFKKGGQRETQNEVPENIHFVTLLFLPRHNNRFFESINTKLLLWQIRKKLRALGAQEKKLVFWTGNPVRTISNLIRPLDPECVIYDNAMRFEKLENAPRYTLEHEEVLVKKCDFVVTDNDFKKNQFEQWGARVYKIPQAVNLAQFDVNKTYEIPENLVGVQHPIVGYYGVLREVVDFELLQYVAKKLPSVSFVFMGNVWDQENIEKLKENTNVHVLPAVPHSQLPSYLAHFDVALIPYIVNDYTQGTFPNKLFEYFSFLKPVVAEPLPEFEYYKDFMYLSSDKDVFASHIEEAIQKGTKNKEKLQALVYRNTWEKRFEALQEAFEQTKGRK